MVEKLRKNIINIAIQRIEKFNLEQLNKLMFKIAEIEK